MDKIAIVYQNLIYEGVLPVLFTHLILLLREDRTGSQALSVFRNNKASQTLAQPKFSIKRMFNAWFHLLQDAAAYIKTLGI